MFKCPSLSLTSPCVRLFAALLFVLLFNTAASALPLVGLTNDNRLLFFDSARPGAIIATRTVTGLQTGEMMLGIDVRPATGEIYAVGSSERLYRINLSTGLATAVGSAPFFIGLNISPTNGFEIGFDFDAATDRARIIANGQNLTVNPDTGGVSLDGALFNAPGEPEEGRTPNITGIAYENALGSTLYGVDWRLDRLVQINPASGATFTVGRMTGLVPFFTEKAVFDVVPGTGSRLALASLAPADGASSRLYVINLLTGEAHLIGSVGGLGSNLFLRGLAALPPVSNIHAVTTTNKLLLFNALLPEVIISTQQITGLQAGESVVAIDTRNNNGRLYALGSTSRLYTLDPETGAATPVNVNPFTPTLSGAEFGMSIHPLQDLARIVSDDDQNITVLPNGVAVHNDPALFYKAGDANAGRDPKVVALAHSPNPAPAGEPSFVTYGIDSDRDVLVALNFPQTGELTTVGSLNLATANDFVGFDIENFGGAAYATLSPICFEGCPSPSMLARIDLTSGRAMPAGFIGTSEPVRSIAIAHPHTIQFAVAEFRVREDCTTARLVVTRAGFANTPAAVEYATAPAASNAPPADPRADYTAAAGTLRFDAGEAVKTIDILISEDARAEGASASIPVEALAVTLSNPMTLATGPGTPRTATLLIEDDGDAPGAANPIDDTATFVCQQYHDFLSREPDPGGLQFWTGGINSCGANAQCREVKRIDTSAAFFLSIEFQETGFFAYRVHKAAFARTPVPLTLDEFMRDARKVGDGVIVGQMGWQQKLEDNKRAYIDEFVQRSDFRALYPSDIVMTHEQYVDALNVNTGGSLSSAERDALVAALRAHTITRAQAFRSIADDADFRQREFSHAFVLMQYFGYLRRNPNDPPDTDFGGYNFWLNKLNSFGGDYRRAEMVKAFLDSIEYRQRFGQ